MRLILFFVCLFSLVLPRGAAIYAASQHISCPVEARSHAGSPVINGGHTIAAFYERPEAVDAIDLEVITDEDTEDEDNDGLFKAKCRILAGYIPTQNHISYGRLLQLRSHCFRDYTPAPRQLTDLYLLQGVLRI